MKKILIPALLVINLCVLSSCGRQALEQPNITRLEKVKIKDGTTKSIPDLSPPILHSKEWENPIPLPGQVNTTGGEDSPFYDVERDELLFFFTPDTTIPAEQQLSDGLTGIYIASRSEVGWGNIERIWLNKPGEVALDGCPTVAGNTLWFCSVRVDNHRSIDIWIADINNGKWENIRNAGKELNVTIGVGEMHINPEGTHIIFHNDMLEGKGKSDLWLTEWIDGKWTQPVNLEKVNTEEDDSRPFVTYDGKELWFTRTYLGSPAIYRSLWEDDGWGEPQLIISQFAGEPTLDQYGNIYFVHHFIEEGAIKDADIYIAYKK